jgi:soluble lytic murein transglycosylase-like protein
VREQCASARLCARVLGLGGLIAGLAAGPVMASVLDIAPDGQVTVIDGPTLYMSSDPAAARRIEGPAHAPRAAPPRAASSPGMPARPQVAQAINAAAQTVGLDPDLIEAVAWRESRLRPEAVSPKGAVGVMQLMPDTARALGVRDGDVASNVQGGASYLHQMLARYDGDLVKALAAYNAGPGAVDRNGGPPPYRETRAYVAAVLERLAERVVPAQPTRKTRPQP